MAIGMTYDQYWYGDPLMVRAFYKAEKIRQERMDEQAWLNGFYVLQALDVFGNGFRKSSETPSEYPKEPLSVELRRREEEEKAEREKEREAQWALAWMSSFVQAGKGWGKNKKKQEGDVPWQTEPLTN